MKIRRLATVIATSALAVAGACAAAPAASAASQTPSANAAVQITTPQWFSGYDWADYGCVTSSAGWGAWAYDTARYTSQVKGTQTTYREQGTFTAYCDPANASESIGDVFAIPVHGVYSGTLVYDTTFHNGDLPYAISFRYEVPSQGWVFREHQSPGQLNYTQTENQPLASG